jgi:hypothetical protein
MGQGFRRGFTAAEKAESVGSLAAGGRRKRLGERLASRHRPFITKWHRMVGLVLRHGVARWSVSTGGSDYDTPNGTFKPFAWRSTTTAKSGTTHRCPIRFFYPDRQCSARHLRAAQPWPCGIARLRAAIGEECGHAVGTSEAGEDGQYEGGAGRDPQCWAADGSTLSADAIEPSARRELAVVHDYDGLRIALRARAEQLDISRLEIDRISGVANGYSSAVLSNTPRKRIGPANLGPILAALGLKLVVVEDAELMARYTARAEKRVPNMAHLNNHNARRATARG